MTLLQRVKRPKENPLKFIKVNMQLKNQLKRKFLFINIFITYEILKFSKKKNKKKNSNSYFN